MKWKQIFGEENNTFLCDEEGKYTEETEDNLSGVSLIIGLKFGFELAILIYIKKNKQCFT